MWRFRWLQNRLTCGIGVACLVIFLGVPLEAEEFKPLGMEDHTDAFEEKILLLEKAYAEGEFDLALSLSESIKDTVTFQKQLRGETETAQIEADDFAAVTSLYEEWAEWAKGWDYFKTVTLSEPVGMARSREPTELLVTFRMDQTTDLHREVRVATIDLENGELVEVPSQVFDEDCRDSVRTCRLFFFADVPAGGSAHFFIFYGNPNAELPEYTTDLSVEGEGLGLSISNHCFLASLSEQTGQLERLSLKWQHGLELYAGGKGHGEPPTLDWSNDYVDHQGFQKLRIRNWGECPNDEVIRGSLFTRVRRWGFPHSPVYPVFTPSRMHIDQSYTFYAGKNYFLKEGTMDAVKDFVITAMRDDEWVLSGYSFTNTLWIDRDGKAHEGEVDPNQSEDLWGVGFFNPTSRDCFIALRLDHSAERFPAIHHNGPPILHYDQHGQLWSRYPAGGATTTLTQGTSFQQKNAYLVSPYPERDALKSIEDLRTRLLNPVIVNTGTFPSFQTTPKISGRLAREGETENSSSIKGAIWEALRQVKDEQLYRVDANIVDMGWVYDIQLRDGVVRVVLTMPHRGRPVYQYFETQGGGHTGDGIRENLLRVEGIEEVVVDFTWDPPWSIARLTEAGRRAMGLDDRSH